MNMNKLIADAIVEKCREESESGMYVVELCDILGKFTNTGVVFTDIITEQIGQHEAVCEVDFDGKEFDITLYLDYLYNSVDNEEDEELEQLEIDIYMWLSKQGVDTDFIINEGGFDYYIDNPRRTQLLEAIEMNYNDVDYDKWQTLEDKMTEKNHGINTEISFKEAMIMIKGLELYGINVLA